LEGKIMKKIMLLGLVSFLLLSGVGLAVQPEERKSGSSMQGMMEEMMKEKQSRGGGTHGMGSMDGMMRMMKMMDQCSEMMESAQAESGDTDSHKK
jgi:hypothetical protein